MFLITQTFDWSLSATLNTNTTKLISVFEQVNDVNGTVHRAGEASAEAPPAMKPVHARDGASVASDAKGLGQTTILTNLEERGGEGGEDVLKGQAEELGSRYTH